MTVAQWVSTGVIYGIFFILFDFVVYRIINKSDKPISINGNMLFGLIAGPPLYMLMRYLSTIHLF